MGGGIALPAWSPGAAIAYLDEAGIAAAVVSISTPGVHLGDDMEARRMARVVNEQVAELVKDHPDRFGFFATLTLPDVDGAIAEAADAFDRLGADGVILLASVAGRYLGDPAFDPLMAALDERSAVVFVHPGPLAGPSVPGLPEFIADFLLDTTRAALLMARNGVLDRYPRLKMRRDPDAQWRLGVRATGLDPVGKRVLLADGESLPYDRVLIATGTRARPWPDPEAALDGVFTLRTCDDAGCLAERLAAGPRRVLVIGGGFTGSEIASACRERGLEVTLAERGAAPLVGALGGTLSKLAAGLQRAHGVDLRCGGTAGSPVRTCPTTVASMRTCASSPWGRSAMSSGWRTPGWPRARRGSPATQGAAPSPGTGSSPTTSLWPAMWRASRIRCSTMCVTNIEGGLM